MQSIRKIVCKPKVDDWSPMAKFYYADESLNSVAAELDSFDGRRDPDRCNQLVNRLRQCQDRVLQIIEEMLCTLFPTESERAPRDFRVKFPDDILHDNLPGQLWFGAECLAAGSNIIDHEFESDAIRPLARSLTRHLDRLRELLKDQSLKNPTLFPEKLKKNLRIFDHLFAEFELNYVSAMVPVKSVREYDAQLDVAVLFSETSERAMHKGYITQEQIDDCDPSVMITLPRLAIVCGLLIYPDGPLNVDRKAECLTTMFRPFQTLLRKIRDLLRILEASELVTLEKALCSQEEPCLDKSVQLISDYRNHLVSSGTPSNENGCDNPSNNKAIKSGEGSVIVGSPSSVDDMIDGKRTDEEENRNNVLSPIPADLSELIESHKIEDESSSSSSSSSSSDEATPLQLPVRIPVAGTSTDVTHSGLEDGKERTSSKKKKSTSVVADSDKARFAEHCRVLRARFRSSEDLVHRLFVCIAGVADQLQTNYPADLRSVLKMVLQPNETIEVFEVSGRVARTTGSEEEIGMEAQEALRLANAAGVRWVPDSESTTCTACEYPFTFIRRRHHCRNCGQIFCSRCSVNSMPLNELGYAKAVRVCNQCFMFKLNPFTASSTGPGIPTTNGDNENGHTSTTTTTSAATSPVQ